MKNDSGNAAWSIEILAIYAEHYEGLVRIAQRLLDRRDLAEEAVQEVFLKFSTSGSSPAAGAELAYLRMAVTNTTRSMMRRRQCAERWRPEHPVRSLLPEDVALANDASDRMSLCLLYTSPSPRDATLSRMPSSA